MPPKPIDNEIVLKKTGQKSDSLFRSIVSRKSSARQPNSDPSRFLAVCCLNVAMLQRVEKCHSVCERKTCSSCGIQAMLKSKICVQD